MDELLNKMIEDLNLSEKELKLLEEVYMNYRNGELLYVCKRDSNWRDGVFVLYRGEHKGDVDFSYHGSPWYENFIVCEYLDSRDKVEFGNETWCWRSANNYIRDMQNKLEDIKRIVG